MTIATAFAARDWPKAITEWAEGDTGYLSVPFTWLLRLARDRVRQSDLFVRQWKVGGPAIRLMPDFDLSPAERCEEMPGVLQRINPAATRTTLGCVNRCAFCGVSRIEPAFRELDEWPDLPILCDNNLLAASVSHLGRVMERLARWRWCDFNQGLDCRLLTAEHARMLTMIRRPIVRLALDNDTERESWARAFSLLREAGVTKSAIRSYVLIGFRDDPASARDRCEFVERFGVKALPMWYHSLEAVNHNELLAAQVANGWTHRLRRELMCWYYQHRTLAVRG